MWDKTWCILVWKVSLRMKQIKLWNSESQKRLVWVIGSLPVDILHHFLPFEYVDNPLSAFNLELYFWWCRLQSKIMLLWHCEINRKNLHMHVYHCFLLQYCIPVYFVRCQEFMEFLNHWDSITKYSTHFLSLIDVV